MKRTQIQLSDEQVRALKEEAAARGVSMAQLIRQAVDRFTATSGGGTDRRRRAISSVGGFRSGRSDISARHDDELPEAFAE